MHGNRSEGLSVSYDAYVNPKLVTGFTAAEMMAANGCGYVLVGLIRYKQNSPMQAESDLLIVVVSNSSPIQPSSLMVAPNGAFVVLCKLRAGLDDAGQNALHGRG